MADDSHFKERLRTELENLGIPAENLGRLEELVDIVDAWVWGESGAVHNRFKAALVTVLMRMPREAVDYLVEGRIFKFVIAYHGVLQIIIYPSLPQS